MASWEDSAAMLPRCPNPLSKVSPAGPKARKSCWFKVGNWSVQGREREKEFLKVKERSGNVYENKGSVFHGRERSGNVIENKDSYSLKAGMLLKKQHVSLESRVFLSCCRDSPAVRHPMNPRVGSKQWAAGTRQDTERKRGGRAGAVSPEPPAESEFDANDSVRVTNAEERDVFSDRPFKLDDPVL